MAMFLTRWPCVHTLECVNSIPAYARMATDKRSLKVQFTTNASSEQFRNEKGRQIGGLLYCKVPLKSGDADSLEYPALGHGPISRRRSNCPARVLWLQLYTIAANFPFSSVNFGLKNVTFLSKYEKIVKNINKLYEKSNT